MDALHHLFSDLKNYLHGLTRKTKTYNMSVLTYSESAIIEVQRGCAAFMFTNIGGDPAMVNEMVIYPSSSPTTIIGDSRSISLHRDDLYGGNIILKFAGTGPNPLVEIVQLAYDQNK